MLPDCTRLSACVLVLALLPGCGLLRVDRPEDGVTVKQLSADLAFGAESDPSVPPILGPGAETVLDTLRELFLEDFDDQPFSFPPLRPFSPAGECPDAPPNAFPAEEATQSVKNAPPASGAYRWKLSGTLEIPGVVRAPLSGLNRRTVRNVRMTGTTLAYDYVIPTGFSGLETQSLEVRGDGVYLTRLRFEAGQNSLDFTPFPLPLKLFSLPVLTGEPVSATGIDPISGLTFSLTGRMGTRDRIDACGTVIDAWKFSGTRVLQSVVPGDGRGVRSTTYDFHFAPQLGGLFVGERAVTTGTIGPLVYQTDFTSTIGELRPGRPE